MGQWGRKEEVCERWYIRWIVPFRESSQPKADVNHETKDHRVIKTSNASFFHYSIHRATVHLLNIHLTKVHPAYLLTTNSFPTGKKKDHKTLLELEMVEAEPPLKYSTLDRCWFHLLQELDLAETEAPHLHRKKHTAIKQPEKYQRRKRFQKPRCRGEEKGRGRQRWNSPQRKMLHAAKEERQFLKRHAVKPR